MIIGAQGVADFGFYSGAAYVVFEGQDGQYYWHLKSANGEIVAVGGEGFSSAAAAEASIAVVQEHAHDEITCWTADEKTPLGGLTDSVPASPVQGTVDQVFSGEMDPFVVGDVCVTYVQQYDTQQVFGLLEDADFCDYGQSYEDALGFAVQVSQSDMLPVTQAEDRELQDFRTAQYFWLDGPMQGIE